MNTEVANMINEANTTAALNNAVEKALRTESAVPVLVTNGNGVSIESLEGYLPVRTRYRELFSTDDAASFVAYVKQWAGKQPESVPMIFITPEKIRCYLNLGSEKSPGHGDHKASFSYQSTHALKWLRDLSGKRYEQEEFLSKLEFGIANITAFVSSAGAQISCSAGMSAIRRITAQTLTEVEKVLSDFSSETTSFEQIQISSKAGHIPIKMICKLKPFAILDTVDVEVRIRVNAINGRVTFMVIWDAEEQDVEYYKAMLMAYITSQLDGCDPSPIIYRGEISL